MGRRMRRERERYTHTHTHISASSSSSWMHLQYIVRVKVYKRTAREKRLINSMLYPTNIFRRFFFLLHYLIISRVYGSVIRAHMLFFFLRHHHTLAASENCEKKEKEELSLSLVRWLASFFTAQTIWCIYVSAYRTVILLLLLLHRILLSYNSCALSFSFFLLVRQSLRQKKEKKREREREREKKT